MMQYFHYIDKVNLIALILMVIVFCVIFENFEKFGKRQGSILYIYMSVMTTILHFIRNHFLHQINHKSFINYSIAICLIGVVFALITEVICVFSNYTIEKEIKTIKKNNKKENKEKAYIQEKLEKIEKEITKRPPKFAYQNSKFSTQQVENMRNQIQTEIMNEYEIVDENKKENYEDLSKITKELEMKIKKSKIKSQDQHAKLDKIKV